MNKKTKDRRRQAGSRMIFAWLLCLAILVSGCGVSGGDQITQMNEKYVAQREPSSENEQQTFSPSQENRGTEQPSVSKEEKEKDTGEKKQNKPAVDKKELSEKETASQTEKNSAEKSSDSSDKKINNHKKASKKSQPVKKSPPKEDTSTKEPEQDRDTVTCYISIDCKNILNNMSQLKESKQEYVPKDGVILKKTKMTVKIGATVYDVLYQVCRQNKIHMEAAYTPVYKTYYVEGIHQLYEFDCGDLSGWNYTVNGVQPSLGSSKCEVKQGDVIAWRFSCDRGKDI